MSENTPSEANVGEGRLVRFLPMSKRERRTLLTLAVVSGLLEGALLLGFCWFLLFGIRVCSGVSDGDSATSNGVMLAFGAIQFYRFLRSRGHLRLLSFWLDLKQGLVGEFEDGIRVAPYSQVSLQPNRWQRIKHNLFGKPTLRMVSAAEPTTSTVPSETRRFTPDERDAIERRLRRTQFINKHVCLTALELAIIVAFVVQNPFAKQVFWTLCGGVAVLHGWMWWKGDGLRIDALIGEVHVVDHFQRRIEYLPKSLRILSVNGFPAPGSLAWRPPKDGAPQPVSSLVEVKSGEAEVRA